MTANETNEPHPTDALTLLLNQAATGDPTAAEQILPLVYDELRRLAAARLAKVPPGQTLQATALVHEAYLRIADKSEGRWNGRAHFFFAAARAMRDILVEDARRKASFKRGGDRQRIEFQESGLAIEGPSEDVLAVDEALRKLEQDDPQQAQLVMLRYFSGLTTEETAEVLGISTATVERRWRFVRAWLRQQIET
ncbi:MAG: ECF-type sigma factor [Planctomycetota bacterium]